jgi:hypothetical protein
MLSLVSDAQAQRRSRYQNRSISRPSASSYLNLFQGGFGGYGQFGLTDPLLAPYLQRNQSTASRRPTAPTSGGVVNPTVQRARAARGGNTNAAMSPAQPGGAPTGTGSVFMQYSHYYQMGSSAPRR